MTVPTWTDAAGQIDNETIKGGQGLGMRGLQRCQRDQTGQWVDRSTAGWISVAARSMAVEAPVSCHAGKAESKERPYEREKAGQSRPAFVSRPRSAPHASTWKAVRF